MREIKDSFDNLVVKLYPSATTIIKSGLSIKCDPVSRQEYVLAIQDSDTTNDFISREQHKVDIMMNMDW